MIPWSVPPWGGRRASFKQPSQPLGALGVLLRNGGLRHRGRKYLKKPPHTWPAWGPLFE
jgi:hypothetical protein